MKIVPYSKYKTSSVDWLGSLPDHWEVKRLKHLGEAIIGLTYDPSEVVDELDGTLVLRSSNVQDGRITLDDNVYVRKEIPRQLVTRAGDILICSRNGSRALIGKNAMIDSSAAGMTFGAFMTIFRSDHNLYLYWVFNSQLFKFQSGAFLTSTINQLTVGNLYSFEVPFPPKSDRYAIAAFLDRETAKIDTLIAKQEELIDLLKEKRQAVISNAVTKGLDPTVPMKPSGVEWLGDVPEHWAVIPLKWRSSCRSGDGISSSDVEPFQGDDWKYPVIGGNGLMGFSKTTNIEEPVIVIGRVGALCGNVHKVSPPAWVTDNALVLNIDRASFHYDYLAAVLKSRNLNEIASKTAQPLITGTQVGDQRLPCPPLHEQNEIVQTIEREVVRIDILLGKAEQAIALQKEHRTALISAAVTGKIDVRDAVSDLQEAA